jgi:hypothetical protein
MSFVPLIASTKATAKYFLRERSPSDVGYALNFDRSAPSRSFRFVPRGEQRQRRKFGLLMPMNESFDLPTRPPCSEMSGIGRAMVNVPASHLAGGRQHLT